MNRFLHKLLEGYTVGALLVVNTLVVALLLNAALSVVFMLRDRQAQDPVSKKYADLQIARLYAGMSERQVADLLQETWSRTYAFEPFTQFMEREYRGAYVNVSSHGFRMSKNQGPWPPRAGTLNVFLFGGSTTFGYGVADDQTIASQLQEYLARKTGRSISVYNFGRGFYYSTQERVLYERILLSGIVPDVALFIDGINDFSHPADEPKFTGRLRAYLDTEQKSQPSDAWRFLMQTALGRAATALQNRLSTRSDGHGPDEQSDGAAKAKAAGHNYDDPVVLDGVIRKYRANKKAIEAISGAFGVTPVFVWQPAPRYKYDPRYHIFPEDKQGPDNYAKYGYSRMAELLKKEPLGDNFLWCADIQSDATEALYVDQLHYTPGFSGQFAATIGDWLVGQRLLPTAYR